MCIKSENFVKMVQTSDPRGANLWPKFEITTVFGAVNVKFDTGERTFGSLPVPNFTLLPIDAYNRCEFRIS